MGLTKKCTTCKQEKNIDSFAISKKSKDGRSWRCKQCRNENRNYEAELAYITSEKGFVTATIGSMFKPSSCKKRGLWPVVTKEKIWELYNSHVKKYGPNCMYCFKPWTYIRRATGEIGKGRSNIKNRTNFSIDRLDNTKTYTEDNIVFCCFKCNDEKHNITLKMVERIIEIKNERKI
ncbi:MAG: hypothetical protein ACPHY7_00380 [Gammaproteobacteria bacterium]